MKPELIDKTFGILLKAVACVCMVVITVIYWQGRDIGKYLDVTKESGGGIILLDTQNGEYIAIGTEGDQNYRLKFKLLDTDPKRIFGSKEFFTVPK
ncbi:MAG: hypothetical protein NT040_18115 [Bacteroidetes bacterium]|nr:hypothetical protein [Bacteroidota bacterium]